MDRLAREGVRCARAYAQNPICTPSRVSILSGQYCHNHGYYGLSGPKPARLPSFLGHFRSHGYCTGAVGKLHVPDDPESWLIDHCDLLADCYDYRTGGEGGASPYFAYLERLGLRGKEDSIRLPEFPGGQQHEGRPSLLPYEHSVEGWCVAEAIRFMDERGGKPFCLHVSLPRPHQCYTPDRRFWDMYPDDLPLPDTLFQDPSGRPPHFERTVRSYWKSTGPEGWLIEPKTFEDGTRRVWRAYLACVTQVDYALGQLLDYLDRTGQAGNTVVIYNADHGAYSTTYGVPEKAPGICSEAVCRVPMLWRVPGLTLAGHVCNHLIENVDIAPTITALCGLPPMDTVDGCDITALLAGRDEQVRDVAATENPWSRALRWGPWRFVHYQPEMFGTAEGAGQDVGELYHLEDDPNETTNLYHDPAHRDTVNRCRRLLLEWLIRTTRVVSVWPAVEWPPPTYPIAPDGKESNAAGPKLRRDRGQLAYL
jgi:choline-sulfatase/uncharacterized sulfatase